MWIAIWVLFNFSLFLLLSNNDQHYYPVFTTESLQIDNLWALEYLRTSNFQKCRASFVGNLMWHFYVQIFQHKFDSIKQFTRILFFFFWGSIVRNSLPNSIKQSNTFSILKSKCKEFLPCDCVVCRQKLYFRFYIFFMVLLDYNLNELCPRICCFPNIDWRY